MYKHQKQSKTKQQWPQLMGEAPWSSGYGRRGHEFESQHLTNDTANFENDWWWSDVKKILWKLNLFAWDED